MIVINYGMSLKEIVERECNEYNVGLIIERICNKFFGVDDAESNDGDFENNIAYVYINGKMKEVQIVNRYEGI